jgi:hypothetical protein
MRLGRRLTAVGDPFALVLIAGLLPDLSNATAWIRGPRPFVLSALE